MSSGMDSIRIQTIASCIPDQLKVADIGGDHGFLLITLAMQKRLASGIVGEVRQGPYENARRNIEKWGVAHLIDVRLGDGLAVLKPEEVDVVVVAGMGGYLISQILTAGCEQLSAVGRLVLQPNIGGSGLRKWLYQHNWQIIEETITQEDGLFYEIIVAEPGRNEALYDDADVSKEGLFDVGPILWRQKHPLLKGKLQDDLVRKQRVIRQLSHGTTPDVQLKWQQEKKRANEWKRVIKWLSTEPN